MLDSKNTLVEISVSYRYAQEHQWVIQGITGFLSAYYMEKPGFQVRRHYDDLETGVHIWLCEIPAGMSVPRLLKRLQADIPQSHVLECQAQTAGHLRYLIDTKQE
ncbi:MAG: hypothetical protein NPIRA02_12250 [Nitrospirales bacterium]|nr:MAG: hypothetical protein NPIRA02_12250 [Nitrospirales bacterium]